MGSITRKQAQAEGLTTYNVGSKPCKRCGGMERYVSDGNCVACNAGRCGKRREARKQKHAGKVHYHGAPCEKDPSHVDENGQTKRFVSNGGCVACMFVHTTKHREALKQEHSGKVHYHGGPCRKDPAHVDEKGQTKRFVSDGKCVACKAVRDAKVPREKKIVHEARRRARKKNATIPMTPFEKRQENYFFYWARFLTAFTGVDHEVDHIWPLDAGGLHHPINLQVLTAQENQSKNAKLILDLITPENLSLHKEKGLLHNIHLIANSSRPPAKIKRTRKKKHAV